MYSPRRRFPEALTSASCTLPPGTTSSSPLCPQEPDCSPLLPASCFCRDEDQLALFQELLGRLPRRVSGAGRRARRYFSRSGDLRHIKRLRFWPLHDVLREKYELPDEEVRISVADMLISAGIC